MGELLKMKLCVIDGQGADLGRTIIQKIRTDLPSNIEIICLGTNVTATSNMLYAGGNLGITGENNICCFLNNSTDLDCLIGSIEILCSGGLNGEITSLLSESIYKFKFTKYIIPINYNIYVPGTKILNLEDILNEIVSHISKTNLPQTRKT